MSFLTMRSSVVSLALLSMVSGLSLGLGAGCASEDGAAAAAAGDENTEDFAQDIKSKTDAQVQAEIEAAAVGANFTSESDYGFTFVSAKLEGQTSMTQALVRAKVASFVDADPATDKPLATLYASTRTFADWKRDYAACVPDQSPDPADCAIINKMNAALDKNLRGIKVFYFGKNGSRGRVDGVGVSVIIVGRTPSGNLAGVRTIAIWT
jgi:hypothetical protein